MLSIDIPETEFYDSVSNEFFLVKAQTIELEHSLASISRWESKWNKPFLSDKSKTKEETRDYIRCMTLNSVDEIVYSLLKVKDIERINQYIELPMTATTFKEDKKPTREIITSELIYYWMTALNIPFECDTWHFNRLLTLIKVCSIKSQPPKKMSKGDILKQNQALNASRRHGKKHI